MEFSIKELISKIENETHKQNAYFDFCFDEDHLDDEHIQANKDGVKLFASMLLRIAYDINPSINEKNNELYNINNNLFFDTQGLHIFYLHLIDKPKSELSKKDFEYKETKKDKIFKLGLSILLLLLLTCVLIGIITIFRWMFY